LFAQGFLINTFNPFPIFFWFTVGNKYHHTHTEFLSITASIVFMVSFTDVLKILLARRIRSFLQAHHIVNLKRLSGGFAYFVWGYYDCENAVSYCYGGSIGRYYVVPA
jgi:threonine/homoserine/homoserine lactone efflux protein